MCPGRTLSDFAGRARYMQRARRRTRASRKLAARSDGARLSSASAQKRCCVRRRERRRRAGEPFALRLAMDGAPARAGPLTWTETGSGPQGQSGRITAVPQIWSDVVLARKDLPTSYHLAVVVDDALQGVTDVVRGQDLFWATGIHRLLQTLLGLPEPVYHHHQLDSEMPMDVSCRKPPRRQASANCAPAAPARRISGAWWGFDVEYGLPAAMCLLCINIRIRAEGSGLDPLSRY